MDELMNYLKNLEPGPVEETTHLERLLALRRTARAARRSMRNEA